MSVSRPLDGINRLPLSQSGDVSFDSRANSTPSDVALFVDWENLKASLNKVEKEPNVSSLRDIAEQFGRVVIASAFADWQDPWHQNDPGHLYSAGIEPVYVPTTIRHGSGGRSSPWARRRNSPRREDLRARFRRWRLRPPGEHSAPIWPKCGCGGSLLEHICAACRERGSIAVL